MMQYTVRYNGTPVATFDSIEQSKKFMAWFTEKVTLAEQQLAFIDEAVLKSDLRQANEVIKHIMEM